MNKLKELRIANNLHIEDMANKLNISKSFYWQLENDARRLSYEMSIKISKIFKLKPDDIFYEYFKKLDTK